MILPCFLVVIKRKIICQGEHTKKHRSDFPRTYPSFNFSLFLLRLSPLTTPATTCYGWFFSLQYLSSQIMFVIYVILIKSKVLITERTTDGWRKLSAPKWIIEIDLNRLRDTRNEDLIVYIFHDLIYIVSAKPSLAACHRFVGKKIHEIIFAFRSETARKARNTKQQFKTARKVQTGKFDHNFCFVGFGSSRRILSSSFMAFSCESGTLAE